MFWPNVFLSLQWRSEVSRLSLPAEGRRGNLKVAVRFIAHCIKQAPQSQSGYSKFVYPNEKYIWAPVHILHETEKAILIDNGTKIWLSKSQIHGIRLKNNIFEIYVKESIVG